MLGASTPWNELPDIYFPELWNSAQMFLASGLISLAVGILLGLLLRNTEPDGLFPARVVAIPLGLVVNLVRSLPFLILMAALIPFTRIVVGTALGVWAAVVPISIAASAYFARIVENVLRDVPRESVAVGRASAGNLWQLVWSVQVREALPGLVGATTILLIVVVEMGAVAGALGAGGIGQLALSYGYSRYDNTVMIACVVTLVIAVQAIQVLGNWSARAVDRRRH